MKSIIVGFSTSDMYLARFIRFVTKSKVSHVYARIPVPEYSEDVVFQASGLNVNYCNYEVFKHSSYVMEEYDIEVSEDQYQAAEKQRVTEVGKPYSYKQLIGFIFVLLARNMGFKIANPFADGTYSYICVEIIARMVGMPNPESATPEDMRRWCEKIGVKKVVHRNGDDVIVV